MTPLVIIATVKPQPHQREALIAAISEFAPRFHEERGCELYALHQNDEALVIVEKWTSADDHRAHVEGRPLAELRARMADLTAGPSHIQRVQPCPAGVPGKGEL